MKNSHILGGLMAILGICTSVHSSTSLAAKPESELDKFSYAVGFQIGQGLKRDGVNVNTDVISQAIRDVLDNKPLQMSVVEMQSAFSAAREKAEQQRAAQGEKAKTAGQNYLAGNKGKKGVTSLPSGVQYRVITAGTGKQPVATDSITAHYEGKLINGKVFDSSYTRGQPATFGVAQVIKGWQEILPMMHTGDKWEVVIPAEHAYGEKGAGADIGPNETLIFVIELISINQPAK